ncbi:hypothetical protein KM043_006833 [Ampulex compressa]|nr:hypothetical protein KM043_006833 [Ampulex compressa]
MAWNRGFDTFGAPYTYAFELPMILSSALGPVFRRNCNAGRYRTKPSERFNAAQNHACSLSRSERAAIKDASRCKVLKIHGITTNKKRILAVSRIFCVQREHENSTADSRVLFFDSIGPL